MDFMGRTSSNQLSQRHRKPLRRSLLMKSLRAPGFDFTWNMRRLIQNMIQRVPLLQHIDLSRVAICIVQARKNVSHGIYASLTPMRFEEGKPTTVRKGKSYSVQQLYDENGREMLYILSFYLPRFMETDFNEKMVTIFHELWHISPNFDGDIRRMPGRCYAHSTSQKEYDEQMAVLANEYLMTNPNAALHRFLQYNFRDLYHTHRGIYGVKIPRPKLLPAKST
jgi:hypothetical protein